MSYEFIRFEVEKPVARLTIARPPLNVMDIPTITEMNSALEGIEDDDDVMFLVISGEGEKAFSVGVDIKDHTPEKIPAMLEEFHKVFRTLRAWDKLSIAAVRGHALGGGCELATACDFVIASEGASFAQPEIDVGCYPPVAAAMFPRLTGSKRAFDLVLTGRRITAAEALSAGLVSRVVEGDAVEEAVEELLETLEAKSRSVLRLAKKALRAGADWEFSIALSKTEDIYLNELAETEDIGEGVKAFVEKRRPEWRHR